MLYLCFDLIREKAISSLKGVSESFDDIQIKYFSKKDA